jgi:hypothetical protein
MPAPMYRVDPGLFEFCTVRQLEYLQSIEKHKSLRAAARAAGVQKNVVIEALKSVERKAAIHGYSPAHDLTRPVAPGQILRGASTLYRRGEAEPVLQWVKSSADADKREEIMRAAVSSLMEDTPRAEPVLFSAKTVHDLCNVYTLTDCHVGMRAWGKETGADWDLAIAERVLCGAFAHMVKVSPEADTGIVAQLGDFLHFDSLVAETPSSRHPLDADSRYSKVVRVAVRCLRTAIDAALQRHRQVIVLIAEGNHDTSGSVWLRQMFQLLYENEPRVSVIDSESPYYMHRHGTTMLGWHHGHLKKPDQLPGLFAAQFAPDWGRTTKRYIHVGHLHHVYEREHSGVTVIQHPTLAARDAWAARGGWISERQVTAITYSSRFGEVARNTVTPEMLAEPA